MASHKLIRSEVIFIVCDITYKSKFLHYQTILYTRYVKLHLSHTQAHVQTFVFTGTGVKRVIQVLRNAVEVYDPALQGSGVCNIFSKNALRNTRKTRNCRDDMVTFIALRVSVRPFCLYSRGRQWPASSHIPCRGHSSSACGMTRGAAS